MSVQALSWAFAQDVPDTGAKFLLVAIANAAGDDGITFRGQDSLSDCCSCATRTTSRNMRKLEEGGLLVRARRFRENGSRTSDWLVLGPGAGVDRSPMKEPDTDEYPEGIIALVTGGGNEVTTSHSGYRSNRLEVIEGGTITVSSNTHVSSETITQEPLSDELLRGTQNGVGDVECVYAHWRRVCGKKDRRYEKMSPGRRGLIKARLKEFSAGDLCRALDGFARDPWEKRVLYSDLKYVFAKHELVDKFLDLAGLPEDRLVRLNGNGNGRSTCHWNGDRRGLSPAQLRECKCVICQEAANFRETKAKV